MSGLSLGCGTLLDADHYQATLLDNPCGQLEVPAAPTAGESTKARCDQVGVTACGVGFVADDSGGCLPLQPPQPCPAAKFAPPGSQECAVIGALGCSDDNFAPPADTIGKRVFVDPKAADDGDGSQQRPLRTIAQALPMGSNEPTTLVLSRGVHSANLNLSSRSAVLRIFGVCAEQTAIVAADATVPVISLGPEMTEAYLTSLSISGGSTGIETHGTKDLTLEGVWLHDIRGFGLSLDDTDRQAGNTENAAATLKDVLIDGVLDSGISSHGIALSVTNTVVQNVSPLLDGGRALGIDLGASATFSGPDPSIRHPGALTLQGSSIGMTQQAGLRVEESSATVTDTWIHDVAADRLGLSRGVDVRGSASQTLPTDISVTGSVIASVSEAGIKIWNAAADIQQTTVRDVLDSSAVAACRGVGISAEFDLKSDPEPKLTVDHSSLQSSERAAIELQGGVAELTHVSVVGPGSPVCGTTPNAGILSGPAALGDAALTLSRSRIDGWQRGVIPQSTSLALDAAVLACGAAPIGAGASAVSGSSLCGCGKEWQDCEVPELPVAQPPCEATQDTTCLRLCIAQVTSWTMGIPNATVWAFDVPGVASKLTDADGCVELAGVPRNRSFTVATSALGFGPGLAMVAPFDAPPEAPSRGSLIQIENVEVLNGASGIQLTDLRDTALIGVRICAKAEDLPDSNAPGAGGTGICPALAGVTAELEPGPPPRYFSENNYFDPSKHATEGADVLFVQVAPGWHRVVLTPPQGKRMHCATNRWGWDAVPAQENAFDVYAEPGFTEYGAELVCTLLQ